MFKKEDSVKYFIGGTAVGVAAGLVVGKLLLPSVSTTASEAFESVYRNGRERSQDDNIYNSLYSQKHMQCCYPRSKSASRYEDKNSKKLSPTMALRRKQVNEFQDNVNDLSVGHKSNINQLKTSCNSNNILCNISIEDNLCDNDYVKKSQEDKQFSNCQFLEPKNTMNANNLYRVKVEENCISNLDNVNAKTFAPRKCMTEKSFDSEQSVPLSEKSISFEFSKVFNNLSRVLPIDTKTIVKNLGNITSSSNNSREFNNRVKDLISDTLSFENISNLAICNSIPNIEETEEDKMLNFTSLDELHVSDLISSTKRNYLGDE